MFNLKAMMERKMIIKRALSMKVVMKMTNVRLNMEDWL